VCAGVNNEPTWPFRRSVRGIWPKELAEHDPAVLRQREIFALRTLDERSGPGIFAYLAMCIAYGIAIHSDPVSLRTTLIATAVFLVIGLIRLAFHLRATGLMTRRPGRWRWIFAGFAVGSIVLWDAFTLLEIVQRDVDGLSCMLVVVSALLRASSTHAQAPDRRLLVIYGAISRLPLQVALLVVGGPLAHLMVFLNVLHAAYSALLGNRLNAEFWRAVAATEVLRKQGESLGAANTALEVQTRELDERNRGMRLVLDHVGQGFLTVDLDGTLASERSAIVDRWFGVPAPGAKFVDYIARHAPEFADWFALGLDSVRDGMLPPELCLPQMPRRLAVGATMFDVEYQAIMTGELPERLLLIISDVTERVIRERAEAEQRELVVLFQRITSDRAGFDAFLDDTSALVAALAAPGDAAAERRVLHTLKGNCGVYGLDSYAALCHAIESDLVERGGPATAEQRAQLSCAWKAAVARIARLIGTTRRNVVEIECSELARVVDHIRQGLAGRELATILTAWTHEPVARRFERLGNHAVNLARRLGKAELAIAIRDDGLRLDAARWAAFWGAMVHAVRNAVDHGIETVDERARAGKPARATLTLTATRARGQLVISVTDDGAGIDWDDVRASARAHGLAHGTQADLEQALFADGLTTAEVVTDTSGRGVGMAALRQAVIAQGGTIEIESTRRAGTTIRCRFPDGDTQFLPLRTEARPDVRIA